MIAMTIRPTTTGMRAQLAAAHLALELGQVARESLLADQQPRVDGRAGLGARPSRPAAARCLLQVTHFETSVRRAWRRVTALSVAPVIAAMIFSCEVSLTAKTPLFRPSRSTATSVRDGLHVGHVVADEQDAETALAQPLDEVEHLGGLLDAECRGRLVEDDDLRLADERAGDGDDLPLAAGERGDRDADAGDADGQGVQQLLGALLHGDLVEDRALAQLVAEEEVGDDVEVVAQRQVLVDDGDAEFLGVVRPVDLHRLALPLDGALVDGMHPGDGLDQGGLAGAVVADEGDDLTGADLQVDVGERLDGAEPFGDSAQRQHGFVRHWVDSDLRNCAEA